jgi:hypothetical protein
VVKSPKHSGKWAIGMTHKHEVAVSTRNKVPISAAAVEAYGLKLPSTYVKQGDVYVYQEAGVSPSPSLPVSPSSDLIGPKGPPPAGEVLRFPPLAELPRLSQAELSALEKLIIGRAEQGIVTVGRDKPKGPRLRFGARPDGVVDIIDAIQDLRGVPRPPANARGGEWNSFGPTFRGPARILLATKRECNLAQSDYQPNLRRQLHCLHG